MLWICCGYVIGDVVGDVVDMLLNVGYSCTTGPIGSQQSAFGKIVSRVSCNSADLDETRLTIFQGAVVAKAWARPILH
jgi:hypothetical protein